MHVLAVKYQEGMAASGDKVPAAVKTTPNVDEETIKNIAFGREAEYLRGTEVRVSARN